MTKTSNTVFQPHVNPSRFDHRGVLCLPEWTHAELVIMPRSARARMWADEMEREMEREKRKLSESEAADIFSDIEFAGGEP